ELALQHAVDALGLLLLPQLDSERREFAPVQAMLAGRIVTSLDGALVGEAARSLEEELHSLTTAQPALRLGVSRHGPPLPPPPRGRTASVVGNRGHVTDGCDLEPPRLQGADGGFATGPRSSHEDLDLLQSVLHGLAGGDLGRRLGGEGRRLPRALESRASRAG